MGAVTHIQWTDHTFNPWEGCTKVSPGCAHCYAEARNLRFAAGANWGPGAPRRRTSAANWKQPLAWNRAAGERAQLFGNIPWARQAMDQATHRPRVFCASLADWLDDEVPIEWLADLLDLIRQTPNLDWLLLTKRPENWRGRIEDVADYECYMARETDDRRMFAAQWFDGHTPANVWIGTTVEDQQRANERIPLLLKIPAKIRFLSCEPLLGRLRLFNGLYVRDEYRGIIPGGRGIDWVICGGESGEGARPMEYKWAIALRDECATAHVPFFFKQWGEHNAIGKRVGKLVAGRLLDDQEHNNFPRT